MDEFRNSTRLTIPLGDKSCPSSNRIQDDISTRSRIVRSDLGSSNFNNRAMHSSTWFWPIGWHPYVEPASASVRAAAHKVPSRCSKTGFACIGDN